MYLAVLISNSSKSVSKSLKFGPKCQFLYFKPILAAIFVSIATGEVKLIPDLRPGSFI